MKKILYFTRISVRSLISELEAVRMFKIKSKKAHHDGLADILREIYS